MDEWAGHRDFFTGAPEGDCGEWTEWDYRLAQVASTIESLTDSNGILAMDRDDPAIRWAAEIKIDPFQKAVEDKEAGKNYKRPNGAYYIPHMTRKRDPMRYPDWLKAQADTDS